MKIYIVTSGSYSDYGINAVFTERNLAEDYVNKFNSINNEPANIEEWDTDIPTKIHSQYYCILNLENGLIKEYKPIQWLTEVSSMERFFPNSDESLNKFIINSSKNKLIIKKEIQVSSDKSTDHAYKKAVELKQEFDRTIRKEYLSPLIDSSHYVNQYYWEYTDPQLIKAKKK